MSPTPEIDPAHRQLDHQVRLDWGPMGAAAMADHRHGVDIAVVVDVDVLSFTTTLTIALERGITVLPCAWDDDRAGDMAREHDAVVAASRDDAREAPGVPSLSPTAMGLVEEGRRVVLPSPNGATVCRRLVQGTSPSGLEVVAACLRNAGAVGRWLQDQVDVGSTVALVPAGERWPAGTLRPAAEDLWGAGAVLSALRPGTEMSPEASLAVAAHAAVADDLLGALAGSASGRELAEAGYLDDVATAARAGASSVVPVLQGPAFVPFVPGLTGTRHRSGPRT